MYKKRFRLWSVGIIWLGFLTTSCWFNIFEYVCEYETSSFNISRTELQRSWNCLNKQQHAMRWWISTVTSQLCYLVLHLVSLIRRWIGHESQKSVQYLASGIQMAALLPTTRMLMVWSICKYISKYSNYHSTSIRSVPKILFFYLNGIYSFKFNKYESFCWQFCVSWEKIAFSFTFVTIVFKHCFMLRKLWKELT